MIILLEKCKFKKNISVVIILFSLVHVRYGVGISIQKASAFDLFKPFLYGNIVMYRITHRNCQQQEFHLL